MAEEKKNQEIDIENLSAEQSIRLTIPALRQLNLTFDGHSQLETAIITLLNAVKVPGS